MKPLKLPISVEIQDLGGYLFSHFYDCRLRLTLEAVENLSTGCKVNCTNRPLPGWKRTKSYKQRQVVKTTFFLVIPTLRSSKFPSQENITNCFVLNHDSSPSFYPSKPSNRAIFGILG
jgi:hypothetical protein